MVSILLIFLLKFSTWKLLYDLFNKRSIKIFSVQPSDIKFVFLRWFRERSENVTSTQKSHLPLKKAKRIHTFSSYIYIFFSFLGAIASKVCVTLLQEGHQQSVWLYYNYFLLLKENILKIYKRQTIYQIGMAILYAK